MTLKDAAETTVIVVGERFEGFADGDRVATVGSFTADVLAGRYDGAQPFTVRPGQGLTGVDAVLVEAVLAQRGVEAHLAYDGDPPLEMRANVRKNRPENVLIAGVRRISEDTFHASLRLHDDNELLLDDQTGPHVQGMVAVEAARQMYLAVAARLQTAPGPDRAYDHVVTSLATRFENTLFPLEATVILTVDRADPADPSGLSLATTIEIWQGGRRVSLTTLEGFALEERRVAAVEGRRARRAVSAVTAAAWLPSRPLSDRVAA